MRKKPSPSLFIHYTKPIWFTWIRPVRFILSGPTPLSPCWAQSTLFFTFCTPHITTCTPAFHFFSFYMHPFLFYPQFVYFLCILFLSPFISLHLIFIFFHYSFAHLFYFFPFAFHFFIVLSLSSFTYLFYAVYFYCINEKKCACVCPFISLLLYIYLKKYKKN